MDDSISEVNILSKNRTAVNAFDPRNAVKGTCVNGVSEAVVNSSPSSNSSNTTNMGIRYHTSKRAVISVIILCFINLINYMDRYTLAGVLSDVKDYYGLNDSQAGLLQTSFIVSYMIMAPVFGYLGDRYNRPKVMACGILFWSITTFLGSVIPPGYFTCFILLRALVGTGEASYSTIAPTIIADLFSDSARTRMLSLFYFAIPVGSGLGYIVGPGVANYMGHWYWALRVTPALGLLSVVLCLTGLIEPSRGQAEGGVTLKSSSFIQDIIEVCKIPSFLFVTLGFTCVTFSVGALAWWVPDFMTNALFVKGENPDKSQVSFVFGVITCFGGIFGVILGSLSSQYYRRYSATADPLICAYSMIGAVPFVFFTCIYASSYVALSYTLIFFGITLLCMNWVIVADIVLYVVIPQRRSMAEAIQITMSHALGDACSPYVIGAISDRISGQDGSTFVKYTSQQYALFLPMFILVLGALFFFLTSFYVVEDKERCSRDTHGEMLSAVLIPNNTDLIQEVD